MEQCREPGCRFVAKSMAGLKAHRRLKHLINAGANRREAEKMLSVLRGLGRIEDIDAARVQTIRSLADELDVDPSNAQMWRTYREAIEDLMRADENVDSSLEQALAEIRCAGQMGDSSTP